MIAFTRLIIDCLQEEVIEGLTLYEINRRPRILVRNVSLGRKEGNEI